MIQPMFGWCETMQHKAMNDIFGKGPCNDAAGEKHASEPILSRERASRTIASKDATDRTASTRERRVEGAPQNTMRAAFEWRGKNYVVSHSSVQLRIHTDEGIRVY